MNGVRHEKYANSINGLPFSLNIDIERNQYNLSQEQNWHENIEIQIFTQGKGTVLLNGKRYDVKEDDIVVVNSNVLHYTFTDSHLVYTCIIISNEWCKRMNIDYNSLHFLPLVKSSTLKKMFSEFIRIFLSAEEILRTAKLNEILIRILVELIEYHCEIGAPPQIQSKAIEAVMSTIEYIHNNFHEKIVLSEIAKIVLVDKYALCREFKKHTGQTIFEYVNHYRSIKAVDFLSEGYTVSQTAQMCGFENLSFFTKTFKKYMGKTPSQCKKMLAYVK